MTRTEKYACAGCDRNFLSTSARRRHYEWNPDHAAAAPDETVARAADGRDGPPLGDDWIEFDDRVETFLTLDGTPLEVQYSPDERSVAVSGAVDHLIDVSAALARASRGVRWTFDGTYLTLSFPKPA